LQGYSAGATQSAVNTLTTPQEQQKLADLTSKVAASSTTAALQAAKAELLSDDTEQKLQKITDVFIADFRQQLTATRDQILDTQLQAEIDKLRDELLGEQTRALIKQLVRQTLDEALGPATQTELAAMRENLVGAPLRQNLNDDIANISPALQKAIHDALQTSVATIKSDAGSEVDKYKGYAIGLGVGAVALVLALAFAWRIIVSHNKTAESHRQIIAKLLEHGYKMPSADDGTHTAV
jgi:preprotein translocase subunit SecF